MDSNVIDHEQAIQEMMAERYLLDELGPQQRDAFEAHLFDCSACFEQVRAGTEFVQCVRQIGAEKPPAREGVPLWRQWMGQALRPAPVFALLFVCFAALSLHEAILIRDFKRPKALPAPMLKAARTSADNVVVAARDSIFSLHVLFEPAKEFTSYEGQIFRDQPGGTALPAETAKGNGPVQSLFISGRDAQDTIAINLYSGDLREGDYRLEVLGVKGDGSKVSIATYYFKLVFQK